MGMQETHADTWEHLRKARIGIDEAAVENARLVARIGALEQENEALREMIAFIAKR